MFCPGKLCSNEKVVLWVKGLGKFITLSITSGDMSPLVLVPPVPPPFEPLPPAVDPAVGTTVNPNVLVLELFTLSHARTCKVCGPGVKVGS